VRQQGDAGGTMSGPARTPQIGGMMCGGPFDGRIMAYGGPAMPAIVDGRRVGTYCWDDIGECWEYDPYDIGDGDTGPQALYEGGYDE
jgi:hypothetical protein